MHGWTDQQLYDEASRMIGGVDPLALAARLDPKRILHVSPWFDQVVPYDLATRWWEAAGRPRRIGIPTGHYSSGFFTFYIHRKCVEHFRAMFGYPPAG
jgi:uncharacterized lipoprotein YddW (UPF0748 family)